MTDSVNHNFTRSPRLIQIDAQVSSRLSRYTIHNDGTPMAPPRPVSKTEQRWFIGTHGNVGGGYESDEMAQVPLKWLMDKAASLGLQFKDNIRPDPAFLKMQIPDSYGAFMGGKYKMIPGRWRPFLRPIAGLRVPQGGKGSETINETIDSSVFDRWRSDAGYRPANLSEWAKRVGADMSNIHTAVNAADLSVIP